MPAISGGRDPGAIGKTGVQEKVVNLAVALRVAAILRPVVDVVMTRETDVDVSLQDRASVEADALISIHANASVFRDANGTETLYYPGSIMGRRLAECIQAQVVQELGTADRGTKERPDLAVLRLSNCPAALVEVAFLSNPNEESNLENPKIHARAAQAIARGIAEAMGFRLPAVWEPAKEIEKLKQDGLINTDKKPKDVVTWGELATVLNRMRR
jgi:N-acetylmuramoyl-L-alanine amidase